MADVDRAAKYHRTRVRRRGIFNVRGRLFDD
jgi:hypothetical protein